MNIDKVIKGQPFEMPADAYNAFVDAARKAQQFDPLDDQNKDSNNFRKLHCLNDSGGDQDQFAILGIDEPIITPTEEEDEFKSRITISGVTPEDGSGGSGSSDHTGRFVVLQEPILDGEIGRCIASGETICKINVVNEDHLFADVEDSESGYLKSSETGTARILWKESGTGEKWAYIRLGDSAGGVGGGTYAYKTTAAPSGGEVTAKRVSYDNDTTGSTEETFKVFTG